MPFYLFQSKDKDPAIKAMMDTSVAKWPDCSPWRPVAWGVHSAARRERQQMLDSCPRRIGTSQCRPSRHTLGRIATAE